MDHRDRVRVLPRRVVLAASVKFAVSAHDLLRLDAYMEPASAYRGGGCDAVDGLSLRLAARLDAVVSLSDDETAAERMREALTAWSWCQG